MTNTNKIESLLNVFGQTLDDLPKKQYPSGLYIYSSTSMLQASYMATHWHERIDYDKKEPLDNEDFICHQSDVIEKLILALETAVKRAEKMQKVLQYANNTIKDIMQYKEEERRITTINENS